VEARIEKEDREVGSDVPEEMEDDQPRGLERSRDGKPVDRARGPGEDLGRLCLLEREVIDVRRYEPAVRVTNCGQLPSQELRRPGRAARRLLL
jgi:hypothetical protein